MRESDDKKGFTRVDHVTFDLVLPCLTVNAQAVFLRIYRQTVGWNDKASDKIANSQFRKFIGISENTVRDAVKELSRIELVIVMGEATETRSYAIDWETVDLFHREWQARKDELEKLSTELST